MSRGLSIMIWMTPKKRPIGEMLREARAAKGLSGRAIGRSSGKPHSYIQKLESGGITPTVTLLEELCPFYGLEPWEAVAGMTKAELLASLPVRPASPLHAELDELIRHHGESAARALLLAGREVQTEQDLLEVLTIFKVIRARRGE